MNRERVVHIAEIGIVSGAVALVGISVGREVFKEKMGRQFLDGFISGLRNGRQIAESSAMSMEHIAPVYAVGQLEFHQVGRLMLSIGAHNPLELNDILSERLEEIINGNASDDNQEILRRGRAAVEYFPDVTLSIGKHNLACMDEIIASAGEPQLLKSEREAIIQGESST